MQENLRGELPLWIPLATPMAKTRSVSFGAKEHSHTRLVRGQMGECLLQTNSSTAFDFSLHLFRKLAVSCGTYSASSRFGTHFSVYKLCCWTARNNTKLVRNLSIFGCFRIFSRCVAYPQDFQTTDTWFYKRAKDKPVRIASMAHCLNIKHSETTFLPQ